MTAVAPSNDFEHCDSHKDLLKVSERLDTSHEIALHSNLPSPPFQPLFAPAHPPTHTLKKFIQPSLHTIATMQARNEATEDRRLEAKETMLKDMQEKRAELQALLAEKEVSITLAAANTACLQAWVRLSKAR
jgi:hypothetical protein